MQPHIEQILHDDQVVFIPRIQGSFNMQTNKHNAPHKYNPGQKSHNHLIGAKKALDKLPHPFMINPLRN
jgi:hypothetical protein